MTNETATPTMDYGREAREKQSAPSAAPSPGMHYEQVDAKPITQTDTRTMKIPGKVSEMYPEDPPADEEVRLADLPDEVTAECLKLFNEGKADQAIDEIRQDLEDVGATPGVMQLADFLADEYRTNFNDPAWKRWAADMLIWYRKAMVARGGGK